VEEGQQIQERDENINRRFSFTMLQNTMHSMLIGLNIIEENSHIQEGAGACP
jgi:hypothetical protein